MWCNMFLLVTRKLLEAPLPRASEYINDKILYVKTGMGVCCKVSILERETLGERTLFFFFPIGCVKLDFHKRGTFLVQELPVF